MPGKQLAIQSEPVPKNRERRTCGNRPRVQDSNEPDYDLTLSFSHASDQILCHIALKGRGEGLSRLLQ